MSAPATPSLLLLDNRRFALAMHQLFEEGENKKEGVPRRIVVACSAGVDSMVLLDLLHQYYRSRVQESELIACYVNHGQRSVRQTNRDRQTIRAFCAMNNIKFVSRKLHLKKSASERDMRVARYQALAAVAKSDSNTKEDATIFTAHHANDNLETFLFRLIRGAHPANIRGILPRARRTVAGGPLKLARPLLAFTKDDLIARARETGLAWNEDQTNADTRYARNAIRQLLIPMLESLRPGATRRVLDFFATLERATLAAQPQRSHVAQIAERLLSVDGYLLAGTDFTTMKAALDTLMDEYSHRTTRAHWESLKRQLALRAQTRRGGGPAKTLQFPGGHTLCLKGNRAFWVKH
ncbi:MAG: tRNA lysidine(34) synthetase TilS [Deltaproteobacteria bacterium]|nr:tRNA lysidine(34) synthetase TilS [Deltaproteobacteria bacterium]